MRQPPTVDPDDPRLAVYRKVRDPELVRRAHRFLAEGRLLVRALLAAPGYVIESVLVTPTARAGLADALAAHPGLTVLEATPAVLEAVCGIHFHQGCLAAAWRPAPSTAGGLLARVPGSGPLVVLERISNPDNVGAIFRSARALGAAGVVLSRSCASPLYRKALRASMGAALTLPFAHDAEALEASWDTVEAAGVVMVALTPSADALALPDWLASRDPTRRVALVLGAEGEGLSGTALERAHVRVRIPMRPGPDSINVAAAAAIALYALGAPGAV